MGTLPPNTVKLSTQLTLLLFVVMVGVAGVSSFLIFNSQKRIFQKELQSQLIKEATQIHDQIGLMFFERLLTLRLIAHDPILFSTIHTKGQLNKRLKELRQTLSLQSTLTLYDLKGNQLAASPDFSDAKFTTLPDYWHNVIEGNPSLGKFIENRSSPKNAKLHFSVRVKNKKGKPFRVLVLRIPMEHFETLVLPQTSIGPGDRFRQIDLINHKGWLIYSNKFPAKVLMENYTKREILKRTSGDKPFGSFLHEHPKNNQKFIVAYSKDRGYSEFPGNDWTLLVQYPYSRALTPINDLRNRIVSSLIVLTLVSLVVSFLLSRLLTRPLRRLIRVAESLKFINKNSASNSTTNEWTSLSENLEALAHENKVKQEAYAAHQKLADGLSLFTQNLFSGSSSDERTLQKSLEHLLSISGVSRVYIFENFHHFSEGLCFRQIAESCQKRIEPHIENDWLSQMSYENAGFQRWAETLSIGREIKGDIPSFPELEKKLLKEQKIVSILVLPIFVGKLWYGFLGLDECVEHRDWDKETRALLQTATSIIGGYLGRKNVLQQLDEFTSQLEYTQQIIENPLLTSADPLQDSDIEDFDQLFRNFQEARRSSKDNPSEKRIIEDPYNQPEKYAGSFEEDPLMGTFSSSLGDHHQEIKDLDHSFLLIKSFLQKIEQENLLTPGLTPYLQVVFSECQRITKIIRNLGK